MLRVELKRILKTRATWRIAAIGLALCLFFAFWAVRLSVYYYYDETGGHQMLRGVEAFEMNREKYSRIEGEVSPELISEAVSVYQGVIARYGDDYSVPPEVSDEVLGPYSPVFTWVFRAFTDEGGARLGLGDVSPERALGFYAERLKTLERTLINKYEQAPQVVDYAMARTNAGESFNYGYGLGSTGAFDHLGMCIFLLTLICSMITAPIFASDYSSGADDILRCTRRGRGSLALARLCSAVIICLSVFVVCVGAFLLVIYLAFGLIDATSAQLLNIAWTPSALTATGVLGILLLAGLLTFTAMSCFTLFLSSRLKSPVVVLAVSIAVALIPTVILLTGADGNALNWFRFCLPSSGALPSAGLVGELASLRFLWLGDFVAWSPRVMLTASAAQIPLWFVLAIRAYTRHQAA